MAGPGPEAGATGEAFDPAGDAGQGTEQTQQGSIFEPYLQSVPEGSRSIVEGYLKDAEKNVNQRLSDAAGLQKQFGEYKDIDLSGVTPEQLSNLITFVKDIGSDPEAYQGWLREEALEAGLIQAEQEQAAAEGEEPDLEEYIQSRIDQALNPVTQKLSQFEQSSQEQKAQETHANLVKHIESSFEKIEKDNDIKLSEEQQDAILALGESVQGDDFVEQGFAKLRALEGGAQAGLVKDKQAQPAPSLRTGGQPAPAKGKTFADVREQALEMARQVM